MSDTKLAVTPTCCNCFVPRKRWSDSASGQMSDMYCRACDEYNVDSPACLANMPNQKNAGHLKQRRNLLTIESELELPNTKKENNKKVIKQQQTTKEKCHLNGKNNNKNINAKVEEYEYADDAIIYNDDLSSADKIVKMGVLDEQGSKLMIRVQGKEELPVVDDCSGSKDNNKIRSNCSIEKNSNINNIMYPSVDNQHNTSTLDSSKPIKLRNNSSQSKPRINSSVSDNKPMNIEVVLRKAANNEVDQTYKTIFSFDDNGNTNDRNKDKLNRNYSTLPKMKKNALQVVYCRPLKKVPMRTTADGTNIYYWCDVPKKTLKGFY